VGGMDCFGQSFGVSLRLDGGVGRFALKTLSGSSSWFGTRWAPDVGDQTTCLSPNKGEEKRGGVKRLRGRTMETKTSKVLEGGCNKCLIPSLGNPSEFYLLGWLGGW
jgi:hypothetical protein